ncbi:NADPH-dependent FMN reductase [Flagellimonas sp. CMM7]|uniref:NADPH-dependent FMN reductase n=1 Tax=Flagellimonas sp. CMM7 TaxID=2654676 RepID=UPI0013D86EC5|nr:NAD(P)H-dependent oxidoreductase [Flagellimonas sp. CMM7]UII81059.1 NAD(P)H-dependent oxidoreductase [Flagellimonas sp. CMM7]
MKNIIVLGGSNSKKSINKKLAIYAAEQITYANTVIIDLNEYQMPIYGIDHEMKFGIPEEAIRCNEIIKSADAFIVSLAEHNGSYTTAFKNTLDWLSRIDKNIWNNKPMLLLSTSPGARGAINVLNAATNYFPNLGGKIVGAFSLPLFNENFSETDLKGNELNSQLTQEIKFLELALQ